MLITFFNSASVEAEEARGKGDLATGDAYQRLMFTYGLMISKNSKRHVDRMLDSMKTNSPHSYEDYWAQPACRLDRAGGEGTIMQVLVEYPSERVLETLRYIQSILSPTAFTKAINTPNEYQRTLIGHLRYMIDNKKLDPDEVVFAQEIINFLSKNSGV